ncbi:glycoside hydrolase [Piromyces finnis]|uniref:Glycoside hydrolase n=1 Tax=Piromyces finnis TaxID=1754191 RepID=A0A1Y1UXR1_9FUNG|nr:glycoside hydrolase [Piromyces finnis]|eukprot:ORX43052.1 glycoside hydrolase [Piromyces finnis]
MKYFYLLNLFIYLISFTFGFDTSKKNSCIHSKKKIVAYFSEWRYSNYPISKVDLSKVTHINYAFGLIDPNSYEVTGYDGSLLNEVVKAAHQQEVKVLMSIGGWYGSRYFTAMTSSTQHIEKFAKSCKNLIDTYNLDGIDIDWEYPGREGACNSLANDTDNYLTLLKVLREKLGSTSLITAAVSIIPFEKNGQVVSDLSDYANYFDFINIMGYDINGSFSSVTSHHSGLFNPKGGEIESLSSGVQHWIDSKFPVEKIVVGIPSFGKSWIATSSDNNGLYQPHEVDNPKGDQEDSNEPWTNYCGVVENSYSGNWKYKNIRKDILKTSATKASGDWTRFWDDSVKGAYLYNKATRQIITYDDPETIKYKMEYVLQHQLSGTMLWELENDSDDFEILSAINQYLG